MMETLFRLQHVLRCSGVFSEVLKRFGQLCMKNCPVFFLERSGNRCPLCRKAVETSEEVVCCLFLSCMVGSCSVGC